MLAMEQTLFDCITCISSFNYPTIYKINTIIIIFMLTSEETEAQEWRNNFFVVIHQVNARGRNLCSTPGLSDSRLQAPNFWAVLPLLYTEQGQENKIRNKTDTIPALVSA